MQNIDPYKEFKTKISPFIKIKSNSVFSVHNVYLLKLISRLRLNFSHLNEHTVRHGLTMELKLCAIVNQPQKKHYTFSCNATNIKQ